MRIGMILHGVDFPPDIRVEKEAAALREAGHEVTVICERHGVRPDGEIWQGLAIRRVPALPTWLAKGEALCGYVSGRHLHWTFHLERLMRAGQFDALHVHDLPLALTAVALGRAHHLPVVVDLHEDFPAMMALQHRLNGQHPVERLIRPWLIARSRVLEQRAVTRADHVMVVVEEARDRLLQLGAPAERVTVVTNAVELERFVQLAEAHPELRSRFAGRSVISYIGGLDAKRGLEVFVDAMEDLAAHHPSTHALFVGDGECRISLVTRVAQRGLSRRVDFTGWVPFEEVPGYVAVSAVGVIPHRIDTFTDTTVPHKLFQYMALGKPVVVTAARPLARIVHETGCGLVIAQPDAHALADAVAYLLTHSEEAQAMGRRGHEAVETRFQWKQAAQGLLEVYARWARS